MTGAVAAVWFPGKLLRSGLRSARDYLDGNFDEWVESAERIADEYAREHGLS